jgi:hypothetical protein
MASPQQAAPEYRGALFVGAEAERLTKAGQCTGAALDADGWWTPSANDLSSLEAHLPALLGRHAAGCVDVTSRPCRATVKDVSEHEFQYAGVVYERRRRIYLSAFPSRVLESLRQVQENAPPDVAAQLNWRTHAITACDGGAAYWGALYDPLTQTFSHVSFGVSMGD